jgi:hypothetical protein
VVRLVLREEMQKHMDEYQKTQAELNKKLEKLQLPIESQASNCSPQQSDSRPQTNTGRKTDDQRCSIRACYSWGEIGHLAQNCQTEALHANLPETTNTTFRDRYTTLTIDVWIGQRT